MPYAQLTEYALGTTEEGGGRVVTWRHGFPPLSIVCCLTCDRCNLMVLMLPHLISSPYAFTSMTKIWKLRDWNSNCSILSEYILFPVLNNEGSHITHHLQGGVEGWGLGFGGVRVVAVMDLCRR